MMDQRDCPVVVVLGATGTGKSKLAIQLARRFGGEILSADSMQVYKGLDIVTNKVTGEEMQLVRHHMIDYVDPLSPYTIVDFRNKALPIIRDLLSKNTVPVIVGGTNYYIESLLWEVLVSEEAGDGLRSDTQGEEDYDIPNSDLHERLRRIDSKMAEIIHPNDRRKMLRSLQVYQQSGRLHSELLAEQKSVEGGSTLGGPLRFERSCIFWLQTEDSVLNKRLDDRVDEMIKSGLIEELSKFHDRYNKQRLNDGRSADYTMGIFQCIGFKEFHSYLLLSEEERQSPEGQRLLQIGVDSMKLVTRRYARKQLKWITHRFLKRPDRQVPPVFALNATDPEDWDNAVLSPAVDVVSALLENKTPPFQPLPIEESSEPPVDTRKILFCSTCQRHVVGEQQFRDHVRSRVHQKMAAKSRKAASARGNPNCS